MIREYAGGWFAGQKCLADENRRPASEHQVRVIAAEVIPREVDVLVLQAVPVPGKDMFKLLRARIRHASTWNWANKARTRLKHVQRPKGGHIRIANAGGVLVAHILPA